MVLDPQIQEVLEQIKAKHMRPTSELSLEEIRKGAKRLTLLAGDPEPIYKIANQIIPTSEGSILIRLYYPKEAKKLPTLIYFHPGGFVRGDVETHDPICRTLANHSGSLVISVNYRLAPENPFPAQFEDCQHLNTYLENHIQDIGGDPERIAVGGESSGGNLAAVFTQLSTLPLKFQLLIYPQLDFTNHLPSHQTYATGYLLEEKTLQLYAAYYLPETADPHDPRISPYFTPDLSKQPPTLIITAEYDPLHDDGAYYAAKLKKAHIPTQHITYPGTIHGFFQMGGVVDVGREALLTAAKAIKKALK